jgi:hypothetical protein
METTLKWIKQLGKKGLLQGFDNSKIVGSAALMPLC